MIGQRKTFDFLVKPERTSFFFIMVLHLIVTMKSLFIMATFTSVCVTWKLTLTSVVIRVIDCCLKQWAICPLNHIKFQSDNNVHFVLSQYLKSIETKICGVEMLFHSDILSWYRTYRSLILLINAVRLAEK